MQLAILLGEGVRATKSESTTQPTALGSHGAGRLPGPEACARTARGPTTPGFPEQPRLRAADTRDLSHRQAGRGTQGPSRLFCTAAPKPPLPRGARRPGREPLTSHSSSSEHRERREATSQSLGRAWEAGLSSVQKGRGQELGRGAGPR